MRNLIIGLNGGYGSGKSTATDLLKESGNVVCLLKFALPLYQIQEFCYRVISPVYTRPEDFVKDRKLLQWLGTDWGRETISQSIWVDLWRIKAQQIAERDDQVVIVCDDVRFDNEAETIKSLGGIIVKINRDNAAASAKGGTGISNHASEAGIRPELIDYTIDNNGTLESYKESLTKLFQEIKASRGGNSQQQHQAG